MPADSKTRNSSSMHSTIVVAAFSHCWQGVSEEERVGNCIMVKEGKNKMIIVVFHLFLAIVDVCCSIYRVLCSFCVGIL